MPHANEVTLEHGEALDIKLGATLLMETIGLRKRFKSQFIGMDRGRFIIARLPANPEIRQQLNIGSELTTRYLHAGGKIYGFQTSVLAMEVRPFPLLFLKYPESVEVLSLRRFERVQCFTPATLFHQSKELKAVIVDISAGGMCLVMDLNGQEPTEMEAEQELMCRFKLFFSEEETFIKAVIRNVEKDGDKMTIGLSFNEVSKEIQKSIQDYVRNVKEFLS